MNVISSILTNNPCYKAGRTIKVKGLMLHSVGCPQPKASVFINSWNDPDYKNACVHAFIDANNGNVYQTLPWNHRGWHGASGPKGSCNNTHIGVEMCEPANIKYTSGSTFTCSNEVSAKAAVKRTYNSAVELFAMLCEKFDLDPLEDGVVISHKEGHSLGIASNHGDPEHLWAGLGLNYTMDGFRKAVKAKMNSGKEEKTESKELYRVRKTWNDSKTQIGAFVKLSYAKKCADENPGYSVFDNKGNTVYINKPKTNDKTVKTELKVKVNIVNLRIRKGPGTNYEHTGEFTGKGVFTIIEEKEGTGSTAGWGRLKSGAGWISLDFAEKLK